VRAHISPPVRSSSQRLGETAASNCTSSRSDPRLFNDRELSFLRFQERIFEEAQDERTPLLERVKFLAIVGTHVDDFVRVRAPELRRNAARRMVVESIVKHLLYSAERQWRRRLLPALRSAGIPIVDYRRLTAGEQHEVDRQFSQVVRPSLSPQRCDPPGVFPEVPTLGMNLIVRALNNAGDEQLFVLRIPDALPFLVPFDAEGYVRLDQAVMANLPGLFPELQIVAAHRFRLLREVDVPSHAIAGASAVERVLDVLRRREANPVAALVADRRMPEDVLTHLARGLNVADGCVHRAGIVGDLRRLWEVSRIARPDLRASHDSPRPPAALKAHTDVLAAAREQDILFHHPYESFEPVVEMVRQAAADPDVVSISMTLYRLDRESPIVHALLDAVRRGRQVRVIIELNARLDEHRNVKWWRILEQAGAAVFPAPAGLKVHAKMTLIVRNEGARLRRYAHLSSGNYNAFTARVYTDLGLLTCDEDITADVAALFDALCGGKGAGQFRALIVSPLTMRQTLTSLVEREIACHRRGERGHIILKMNGLVDRDVIRLLYQASQEGVHVDLLVRGICCLRPGVPGLSERIRVRSIVGRFLEHSRVWSFRNGGCSEVYVGSADLMPRNLDRRVEIMAPLKDAALRRRVFEVLRQYLADNVKARELRADGTYVRTRAGADERLIDAQLVLLHEQTAAACKGIIRPRRHLPVPDLTMCDSRVAVGES
jgi:polyphosphate kinase